MEDVVDCDYVVPLGITLPEKEAEDAERILLYQDYISDAKESMEEMLEMAGRICTAVGCEYQINDEQRIDRKEEIEAIIRIQQRVDAFFDQD